MLSKESQDFIRSSPFLFIASRARNGQIDVSPRGDDPVVLKIVTADTLILPDRVGNNRLDTVGNMLDRPDVCLAVLVRGSDRFLRIRAQAAISVAPEDLQPFEIRGQLPMSVARLKVHSADFISTRAFADAQFWSPPQDNKAPLDLFAMIKEQLAYHAGQGALPEVQQPSSRNMLERTGFAGAYQPPSHYVQRKSFSTFDPHTREFLKSCRFAVLAFTDENGELEFVMSGGEAGLAEARDARHMVMKGEGQAHARISGGMIGGLFVRPGMPETLRLNAAIAGTDTTFETREMFLHCSNSFIRSRIWRPKKRLAWLGAREFICRERVDEATDVVSFLLAPVDDAPLEPFHPGQYVTVTGAASDGRPLQRCYSLSNAPKGDHFRITVKRHGEGQMSRWLHDHIVPGSSLELGAPRGRFRLDDASRRPLAFISAGVGITPMLSMLASAMPDRPVWFIHGARNGHAHVMRDHVRRLAESHAMLRTHFVYSQPDPEDLWGRDYDQHGRIGIATLETLLDLPQTDFYLCGPNDFMMALKGGLKERGVPDKQIRMEIFGAGGSRQGVTTGPPATVTFVRSGVKAAWTSADGPLLDLALSKGLDAPYVCRQGDCQSCVQRLLTGTVAYPADLDIEPTEGSVLLCQATPMGDVSIEL